MKKEQIEAAAKAHAENECKKYTEPFYNEMYLSAYNTFIAACQWASSQSGWVDVKDRLPGIIEGKTWSENVHTVCDGRLCVMAYCLIHDVDGKYFAWCNCYGKIDGDPQNDDDYDVTFWQPLPPLPSTNI